MKTLIFIGTKIICIFLVSIHTVYAQEIGKLSYGELPDLVRRNNGSVKSARLLVKASEKRVGHLLRSFLPNVKASVGYENYTTINVDNREDPYGGVEAKINIFNFGQDRLEEKIRGANLKKSQESANLDFISILSEARRIFWKIVYHNELILVLKAAEERNKNLLDSANRRIMRGLTTKTDQLEFSLYGTDLKSNIESLVHENKILKIALGKYLGKDISSYDVDLKTVPHNHEDGLMFDKFNKELSPVVRLALAKNNLLDFQSRKAKRWWAPTLDVYGGYSLYTVRQRDFLNRADRDDTWLGIRLSMNIFDGNRSSSEASYLQAQAEAAKVKLRYVTDAEKAEFMIIKEEIKHADELTHFSEDKIKMGNTYFERTLKEYDKGVKNSLDALSALQRVVAFKVEYANIRLEYQLKQMSLKKLRGV